MWSTKVGPYMKQYFPNKPKKWGFKFFALCDITGFMYKFEIYIGEKHSFWPGEPNLKASANIAVRMKYVKFHGLKITSSIWIIIARAGFFVNPRHSQHWNHQP